MAKIIIYTVPYSTTRLVALLYLHITMPLFYLNHWWDINRLIPTLMFVHIILIIGVVRREIVVAVLRYRALN